MLKVSFLIALAATIFFPIFLPSVHLLFFLPYFVGCCYRLTRLQSTMRAFCCGLIIDFLSSASRFGLYTLASTFAVLLCYGFRQQFFEEKLSTLPLMTFIFSICFSALDAILSLTLSSDFVLCGRWLFTDLFEMAIGDALYALVLFALPFQLTRQISRMRQYALARKKHC